MKIGVSLSIDVTQIDKARLYTGKPDKNGKCPKYLSMTTFIDVDQKDQYDNNGFISEQQTQQEREQKIHTTILGNCKIFWSDAPQQQAPPPQQSYQQPQHAPIQQQPVDDFSEEIPF